MGLMNTGRDYRECFSIYIYIYNCAYTNTIGGMEATVQLEVVEDLAAKTIGKRGPLRGSSLI